MGAALEQVFGVPVVGYPDLRKGFSRIRGTSQRSCFFNCIEAFEIARGVHPIQTAKEGPVAEPLAGASIPKSHPDILASGT